MIVLLNILIETLLLMACLWIGKSIMKAQIRVKTLVIAALAGACASQVPFVGLYLSTAVVLFFLWKMARIDMVPDGALIVILGKGVSFIAMIYVVGAIWDRTGGSDLAAMAEVPVYEDSDGIVYYAEDEKVYYRNADDEKVYVDSNVLFGLSGGVAGSEKPTEETANFEELAAMEAEKAAAEEAARQELLPGFSEPYLSDLMVRGEPMPFLMFVPRGWSVKKENGVLSMRIDDHDYIHCFGSSESSNNKAYLRKEVNRVMSQHSGYKVAKQEIITMDKRQWARIQFANSSGDQILLITHGGKYGCYTVELNGSFQQLSSHKADLNRIITSFKFPASTYFIAQAESEEDN